MGHHAMMDPAKVDARLDKLKTDLKLTSAQQGAWQRYAGFVREQAKQHREQFDKMREQTRRPTRRAAGAHERAYAVAHEVAGGDEEETRRFMMAWADRKKRPSTKPCRSPVRK